MIVKTNQELKNYEGKTLKEGDKPVFLRSILVNALNFQAPDSKSTVEEKLKAYKTSMEIMENDEVNLSVEEIVLIKKNVNLMYAPLIVGQVVLFLEEVPKTN